MMGDKVHSVNGPSRRSLVALDQRPQHLRRLLDLIEDIVALFYELVEQLD